MEQVVILSKLEQEYLLRVIEAAVQVREPHQLFLWSQGQLQALLPHQAMVCLQFDGTDALVRLECLHGTARCWRRAHWRRWPIRWAAWRCAWRAIAATGGACRP